MIADEQFDAVIVGAGLAGLYALYRLRQQGLRCRVFEAGDGVGGTWYWNRYPGARCDIESMAYSYSFSPELEAEWEWTERYAGQPEILAYLEHVADRFDLRSDIAFETRVESSHFDEATDRWHIRTDRDDAVQARYVVMATGCLSVQNVPDIAGLDRFRGPALHTGSWPKEGVDFSGLRVGVIGTGSTGIQIIPQIAESAEQLHVFQRTPNFTIPARNFPMSPRYQSRVKQDYASFRKVFTGGSFGLEMSDSDIRLSEISAEERQSVFEKGWERGGFGLVALFGDIYVTPESNDHLAEFIRGKIRATVHDPATADLLCPHDPVGCKRPCADTEYYEAFNRDNVTLVDLSSTPIETVTAGGIVVGEREIELDVLVLATGFDAMTGALERIDIRGRGGLTLRSRWAEGPKTYLGLAVDGFPNLFTITGPGSPSVLANMIPAIEQHVDWIAALVAHLEDRQIATTEPTVEAVDAWVEHVNERAGRTVYTSCNSWYLGANIPGKPRVFMPYLGFEKYIETCDRVAAEGYPGFRFDAGDIR